MDGRGHDTEVALALTDPSSICLNLCSRIFDVFEFNKETAGHRKADSDLKMLIMTSSSG